MRPYVINWGRSMYMKPTCTISTILLWFIPTSNCRIRWHQAPPLRWSIQAEILLDTKLSSISSASRTNIHNNPSGLYAWLPGDYTKTSSVYTITWPITYHDQPPHQIMGWSPISWTHVLSELVTGSILDLIQHRWRPGSVLVKNAILKECVRDIPSWLLQQNSILIKIGVSSTISQHKILSSIENIFQTS